MSRAPQRSLSHLSGWRIVIDAVIFVAAKFVPPLHRATAERLNGAGLSQGARITLTIVGATTGVMMILIAPPETRLGFYAFAAFTFAIALCCLTTGRSRQFFGSLIGSVLCGLSIYFLWCDLFDGHLSSTSDGATLKSSIGFLLAFGTPGLAYVVRVGFGFRRRGVANTAGLVSPELASPSEALLDEKIEQTSI